MKLTESKLRSIVREEIIREYGTDADPGRATAASPGGPGTDWFQVARLVSDIARERREVKDVGQKEVGGETVHEFALSDRVYQIRRVQ